MKNDITHINGLLASTAVENNHIAFLLLKENTSLLTEAVFPLLAWRFFALDFDHIVKNSTHSLNSTGMVDDMLSIITFFNEAEASIWKPFYRCYNALNILTERIDLYSKEEIKEMLEDLHPYIEIYKDDLKEESWYLERLLFVAREVYHTYKLQAQVYPLYHFLSSIGSLVIGDKTDFINIVTNLSSTDKEKYSDIQATLMNYADDCILHFPAYAAQYHCAKGILYDRYEKYNDAIASYEASQQLNPKNEIVLNNLAWLLYKHSKRWEEAYLYASTAVKIDAKIATTTHSRKTSLLHTLGVLELSYKQDRATARCLFLELLDINPDFKQSKEMLDTLTI